MAQKFHKNIKDDLITDTKDYFSLLTTHGTSISREYVNIHSLVWQYSKLLSNVPQVSPKETKKKKGKKRKRKKCSREESEDRKKRRVRERIRVGTHAIRVLYPARWNSSREKSGNADVEGAVAVKRLVGRL